MPTLSSRHSPRLRPQHRTIFRETRLARPWLGPLWPHPPIPSPTPSKRAVARFSGNSRSLVLPFHLECFAIYCLAYILGVIYQGPWSTGFPGAGCVESDGGVFDRRSYLLFEWCYGVYRYTTTGITTCLFWLCGLWIILVRHPNPWKNERIEEPTFTRKI